MLAFTQHATSLSELTTQVPTVSKEDRRIKNREANLYQPAAIIQPTKIPHIQDTVLWALKHKTSLTVIGGGHSGHCIWPNVVAIDMSAFNYIEPHTPFRPWDLRAREFTPLAIVDSGCTAGKIMQVTSDKCYTIPLGSRPSVGAGLWLQGGIGHLARSFGLSCDSIVGAVIVSLASADIVCVGAVPEWYQPAGSTHVDDDDLLWAVKGAGTNIGIVVSVVLKAYELPVFSLKTWIIPLDDDEQAHEKLQDVEQIAKDLPKHCSADVYLFWDREKLRLGVTLHECPIMSTGGSYEIETVIESLTEILGGLPMPYYTPDIMTMLDRELYQDGMHYRPPSGPISSFKRCVFFKNITEPGIVEVLLAAMRSPPTSFCYFHLLQGGKAVQAVSSEETAFGCRDWGYACVITGVWPRDQDGSRLARSVVNWVYEVCQTLLPLSVGVYGTDLGPDPRDIPLAIRAFGPNLPRILRLKQRWDPNNILAYTCPLPLGPKLVVLVTGDSGVGKDHCAEIWASELEKCTYRILKTRSLSISKVTKREYAASTGADLQRLLHDRAYKEQHRSQLSEYFQSKVRLRPDLPQQHFMTAVHSAADVDVLFVTGMRDSAPVASFSHLIAHSKVIEVHVTAGNETRKARRMSEKDAEDESIVLKHRPDLIFNNDATGDENVKAFCKQHLTPYLNEGLEHLTKMIRAIPNFPRPGVEFRDVLGLLQQPGGLVLCTSLLHAQFMGDWNAVDKIVCCETGGFCFASALAAQVNIPLGLVREAGKLPPPTVSLSKPKSYISSTAAGEASMIEEEEMFASEEEEKISASRKEEKRIELGADVVAAGASVVVVDDVLASGRTVCAVLQLLGKIGVCCENINVLVVAEFAAHRGRELLLRRGFGMVRVQSLLCFGGK